MEIIRDLLVFIGAMFAMCVVLIVVENPGDAKRYDDKSVEASPGEPVEPRRNGGFDQFRFAWSSFSLTWPSRLSC
jgi:hypothetical protein